MVIPTLALILLLTHSCESLVRGTVANKEGLCRKCEKIMWISDGKTYDQVACGSTTYFDNDCGCTQNPTTCDVLEGFPTQVCNSANTSRILALMEAHGLKRCDVDQLSLLRPRDWCADDAISAETKGCSKLENTISTNIFKIGGIRYPVQYMKVRLLQPKVATDSTELQPKCDTPFPVSVCDAYPSLRECQLKTESASTCISRPSDIHKVYVLQGQDCVHPISCYGMGTYVYYPTSDELLTRCGSINVHCSPNDLMISVKPSSGTEIDKIEVCGSKDCHLERMRKRRSVSIPRDFYSKTSDSRLKVTSWNSGRLCTEEDVECEIMEVCAALDCFVCWEYTLNPHCWGTVVWVLALIALWILLTLLGSVVYLGLAMTKGLIVILRVVYYLVTRPLVCLYSGLAKKIKERVEEVKSLERKPIVKTRPPAHRSRVDDRKILLGLVILGVITGCLADSDSCFKYQSLIYKSESCSKTGNITVCEEDRIVESTLLDIGTTSCFEARSEDGSKLGSVSVTPLSLYYKCEKSTLYYTFNHKMIYDSIMHCPNAGQCSGDWCEKVGDNTTIDDLVISSPDGPGKKMCLRGNACAGNGCFYCTQSCISLKWYASPMPGARWEVFECTKWQPHLNLHIRSRSGKGSIDTTLAFSTSALKTLDDHISLRAEFSISAPAPITSRKFMTDGENTFMLDVSPAGFPQKGLVGQVQCKDQSTPSTSCSVAPSACVCSVSGVEGVCSCSEVDLSSLDPIHNRLPQHYLNTLFRMQRSDVVAVPQSLASAKVTIHYKGKLGSISGPVPDCSFQISKVEGCYNCHGGALVSYSCYSTEISSPVIDCGSFNTSIVCDPNRVPRTFRTPWDKSSIQFTCKAKCSKASSSVSGTLAYVGYDQLNSESIIHLVPRNFQNSSNWSWNLPMTGFHFLSSLTNLLGFLPVLGTILLSLLSIWLIIKIFPLRSRRKHY
uniref:Envelope glycoprotein n=1 Tax=Lygus hesperus TaxID=30085 RepID=A0A0A9XK18_LYGHE